MRTIHRLRRPAPRANPNGVFDAGRTFVVFGRGMGDLDGDVDLADFLIFQRCFSGEERPPTARRTLSPTSITTATWT